MTLLALTLVLPAVWLAGLMLAPLAGRDRPGAGPGAGSRPGSYTQIRAHETLQTSA